MGSRFSDSWYQVAQLKVGLLPTVRVHKQKYRDQLWYVLMDSCSEKYYRVHEVAYQLIARLHPEKTVEEVWMAFLEAHPEDAPSQDEMIGLLSQLHEMNLLFYRSNARNEFIFERYTKQRRKEKMSHLLAFLYFRIPVWNPNVFLKRNIGWLGLLFTPLAFAIWLGVFGLGAKAVLENLPKLTQQAQGILSFDNIIWLYISMFVLKMFHEMGHAIVCRKYGGNVHNMGVMFIALTPLPYIDASSSWSMRSPWHRAFVGASGMYVELFFAAIAALVWSQTAPGFVNSLAFNLMIIGSISSIAFNGNPLLKFDAYYILSDITGLPNLYQKAMQQWFYLGKVWLLRVKDAEPPAQNRYERHWYYGYGLLSFLYRIFVMTIIMVYMADISLFLGALMLLAILYMWVVGPTAKLLKYLSTSPELRKDRIRPAWVSALTVLGVLLVLTQLPMPYAISAPGVVQSDQRTTLFAQSGGTLESLLVRSGDSVDEGQVLMRFSHPELELETVVTESQLREARWLQRQAIEGQQLDLATLKEREVYLEQRLTDLRRRLSQLEVRAPYAGVWISDISVDRLGSSMSRNQRLGLLLSEGNIRFVAAVAQEKAANLFAQPIASAEIRLRGRFSEPLQASQTFFIPYQKHELPSAAMGIPAGGPIMANWDERGRMLADEPFFELQAVLDIADQTELLDGVLGSVRIMQPPMPLLQQAVLRLRQLLQARYQL
jgi:putative peptide zinc metalloprotease protein